MRPQWASNRVNFLSDNRSVVEILWSGTSRTPAIMSLVHYLSLLAAHHSFSFTAFPIRGKSNPITFAQHRLLDCCAQDNSLSPSGSALPASKYVLIHFCCHLADTLHHSSVKVYLSAIRSLHIEEGLPGWLPLVTACIAGYQTSPRLK